MAGRLRVGAAGAWLLLPSGGLDVKPPWCLCCCCSVPLPSGSKPPAAHRQNSEGEHPGTALLIVALAKVSKANQSDSEVGSHARWPVHCTHSLKGYPGGRRCHQLQDTLER